MTDRTASEENPNIRAELVGELEFPSGQVYEIGVGGLLDPGSRTVGDMFSGLPKGPWRAIHFRLKGRSAWLRGYSSAFLFSVGRSGRRNAGADLFPSLSAEHARKILEIAGMPTGRLEE